MKRIVLGLLVVAMLSLSAAPLEAHGRYPYGWRGGYYAGYGPRYNPYAGGHYHPRRVYYPAVPVYPAYPVYPSYPPYPPRAGFSYFGPGFSFSVTK
ncbi:MAG: hypothetical protein AB7O59_01845 [Pirellulales bacterium]